MEKPVSFTKTFFKLKSLLIIVKKQKILVEMEFLICFGFIADNCLYLSVIYKIVI